MIDWKLDSHAFQRLSNLIQIVSPSMNESAMASYLRELWSENKIEVSTDVMGNIHTSANKEGSIHIGLVAHMDTITVQISNILPNGMLRFRSIGLGSPTLLGQNVKVLTEKGCINGVVGFDPTSQYESPKGLTNDDLWLDIGAFDYENATAMVDIGDLAVLTPVINEINDKFISGTGIDDRIGLFIISECLHLFMQNPHPSVCLHVIGTTQEEVGLRGAKIIASQNHLDACFVVDVDYATDTLTPLENQMGALHLGKGVGIHIKSDNNPVLRKIICEIANKKGIAYQKSLGRFVYGGTDATSLQLQCGGIATMNINIPCRYMHSPVEICHRDDVESAVKLLMCAMNEIGERELSEFIPA